MIRRDSGHQWRFMNDFWFDVSFILDEQDFLQAKGELGSDAPDVFLVGDFNKWSVSQQYKMEPCSKGFSFVLPLSQGYYHYKFVLEAPGDNLLKKDEAPGKGEYLNNCATKQHWLRDPGNPHVGGEYDNSIMFVHMDPKVYGIRPQYPPHRDYSRIGGNGSEFRVLCPALSPDIASSGILQRLIFVYLPPSYSSQEERTYPVIYANDGQNLLSTPAHLGGPCKGGCYLDEKLDQFWNQNLLQEFILVCVPNSDFVCIGNRDREYCTSCFHDTSQDPYKRYLVEVVKKEVDEQFRTISTPEGTVLLGFSMGGLCAFTLALNHPDIFSSCVCMSSSFWYVDQQNCTAYDLVRSHSANKSISLSSLSSSTDSCLSPKIYIDSGNGLGDNFYETKEMRQMLLECGWKEGEEFKHVLDECAEREDGITHSESVWKERILAALQFSFS